MEASNSVLYTDERGLNGLEVHLATLVDRFRDACRTGDLDAVQHITSNMSEADILQLIHRPSFPGHEGHHPAVTGSPMFEAVLANQVEIVDYLASLGYDLEHECEVHITFPIILNDHCTALCLACASGALDVVRVLLRHGANVNHTSRHSSPIIYASDCKDVELAALLLDNGANICTIDDNPQSYPAVLPLYQACINGHKETAELFLCKTRDQLSPLKHIGFLGLLGAQCINRHTDFTAGVGYWRLALSALCSLSEYRQTDDLVSALRQFNIDGKLGDQFVVDPPSHASSLRRQSVPHRRLFRDVQLCSTVAQLDELVGDEDALTVQALLLLQTILGPSHQETLFQMSQAARLAQENGDSSRASFLYVYVMECSEACDKLELTADFSSQLADLLMNIHFSNPPGAGHLSSIADISELIAAAIEILCSGMCKMQMMLFPQSLTTSSESDSVESKLHSRVRLFTEMVETLMAFLRLFTAVEQLSASPPSSSGALPSSSAGTPPSMHYFVARNAVSRLVSLCDVTTPTFSKFSVICEMMKIAVHGDHSTLSTLYFFQEDLFPDVGVLRFLLRCGASINCRDFQGDTPLHQAIECRHPSADVIRHLLRNGAHIDACNRSGKTPEVLLRCCGNTIPHGVDLFDLVTLRCLAARVVIDAGLEYRGGILPHSLEAFLQLHSAPDVHHSVVSPLSR